jgi:hypothetical protein
MHLVLMLSLNLQHSINNQQGMHMLLESVSHVLCSDVINSELVCAKQNDVFQIAVRGFGGN